MKLTQEQKRIKIAEACGWKRKGKLKLWNSPIVGGGWEYLQGLPDYFNDLNACHEMERAVLIALFSGPENDTASGSERLCIQLENYKKNLHSQYFGMGSPWHYTAAQRAQAFGLTLNLWKAGE